MKVRGCLKTLPGSPRLLTRTTRPWSVRASHFGSLKFLVRSACGALHQASHPPPGCNLSWETWATLKIKLFLWLALKRPYWKAYMRRRQTGDTWQLFPMPPATGIHWSHNRGVLLLQASLVVHSIGAKGNTSTPAGQLNSGLVDHLERAMDRAASQQRGFNLRISCLGAMERKECTMLPPSEHSNSRITQAHQARGWVVGASRREEPRLSFSASNRVVRVSVGGHMLIENL
jgi:hypothetical protein